MFKYQDQKSFNVAVQKFTASGKKQREEMHALLLSGLGLVQAHWNADGLSRLLQAIVEVRTHDTKPIMEWLYYATGGDTGRTDGEGLPIVQPENSVLSFKAKEVQFSIKKIVGVPDKEAEQERRIAALEQGIKNAAALPFWNFKPAKVEMPYKVQSLIAAIRKANANLESESLTAKDREFIGDILALCETHSVQVEK